MNWYKKFSQSEEVQAYIQANIDSLAKQLIQKVWNSNFVCPSNKYNDYHIQLAIDNDRDLSNLAWSFGEEGYNAVINAVSEELSKREDKVYEKRKEKLQGGDKLQHIKDVIKGKSWNGAKKALFEMMPMGKLNHVPDDEDAESVFQRLYNTTLKGTFTDVDYLSQTSPFKNVQKRLSEIRNWNVQGVTIWTDENYNKYIETQIFNNLFGYKSTVPPETITVYRGVSRADAEIRTGDYVTPDKSYARSYMRGKKGAVIKETLPTDDLIVSKIPYNYESVELVYYPRALEGKELSDELILPPMTFKELYGQVNQTIAFNLNRFTKQF